MPSITFAGAGASGSSNLSLPSLGDQVILLEAQNNLLKNQMTVIAVEVNLILDWVSRTYGNSVVNANSIYYKDIHQSTFEVERIKKSLQPEGWTEPPEQHNGAQNDHDLGNGNENSSELDHLERTSFLQQIQDQNQPPASPAATCSSVDVNNSVTDNEDIDINEAGGEVEPGIETENGTSNSHNEIEAVRHDPLANSPGENEATATATTSTAIATTGVPANGNDAAENRLFVFSIPSTGLIRRGPVDAPKSERKERRFGPSIVLPRVATTSSGKASGSSLRTAEDDKARRLRLIRIATSAAARRSTPVRLGVGVGVLETRTTKTNGLRSQTAGRGRGRRYGPSRSRRGSYMGTRACPQIVYRCRHCSSTFSNENVRNAHERNHNHNHIARVGLTAPTAKRYKCPYCPRTFDYSVSLISHEKSHTGEKSFSCEYCHNTFKTQSQLSMHLRTHVKERPFPCGTCDRSYFTRQAMNAHARMHRKS